MPSALPEACRLPPESFQRRMSDLRAVLLPRVVRVLLREGLLSFALPLEGDNVAAAAEFVGFEQRCCDFARFERRLDPAHSLVWVDVRADAAHQPALVEMAELLRRGGAEPGARRRLGVWGVGAGAVGLLCCATPAVAALAALLGLQVATLALVLDATFGLVLVTSVVAVAYGLVMRHRHARHDAGLAHGPEQPRDNPRSACGCSGARR